MLAGFRTFLAHFVQELHATFHALQLRHSVVLPNLQKILAYCVFIFFMWKKNKKNKTIDAKSLKPLEFRLTIRIPSKSQTFPTYSLEDHISPNRVINTQNDIFPTKIMSKTKNTTAFLELQINNRSGIVDVHKL